MPPTDSPEDSNMVELLNTEVDEGKSTPPATRHPDADNSSLPAKNLSTDLWVQDNKKDQPGTRLSYNLSKKNPLPILKPLFTKRKNSTANANATDNAKMDAIDIEKLGKGDIGPEKLKSNGFHGGITAHPSQASLPNSNSTASLVPGGGGAGDTGCLTKMEESAEQEGPLKLLAQIVLPFFIAGIGMVGAGLVMDQVQHWEVFTNVKAIYIVVPPLLGLKGNLEMTLASRLSTLTNLGYMDSGRSKFKYIGGNMVISQCLASMVGLLTSLLAIFISSLQNDSFNLEHSLLLVASSVATAAASSCILDSVMVAVILISRRFNINPDNVATPIAASLGDITTISLLAGIASAIYNAMEHIYWLAPIVASVFLLLVPLWIYCAFKHAYTAQALKTTTLPVVGAMFISTGAGFILDVAITKYTDLTVFQPIINGVGGNLVAVYASRIATSLHRDTVMGLLPSSHPKVCVGLISVFLSGTHHSMCARVLLSLVAPGHLVFITMTSFIAAGAWVLTGPFVGIYLVASFIQVSILLYVANILTYLMWNLKVDPDNICIPLLTALGDLLGIGLLFISFLVLDSSGEAIQFLPTNNSTTTTTISSITSSISSIASTVTSTVAST